MSWTGDDRVSHVDVTEWIVRSVRRLKCYGGELVATIVYKEYLNRKYVPGLYIRKFRTGTQLPSHVYITLNAAIRYAIFYTNDDINWYKRHKITNPEECNESCIIEMEDLEK